MAYINVDEVFILDNTGLQVDMAADIPFADAGFTETQKEQARKNIAAGGTNPNLLDNPWFRVNQRGVTSGTHTTYPADRWQATYGGGGVTWSRTDDTITVQSTNGLSHGDLYQNMEPSLFSALMGKTVTVSVMLNDYSIISATFEFPTNGNRSVLMGTGLGGDNINCVIYSASKRFEIEKFYTAETYRAFKLELGSVSTLANDAPPDYGTELAKCQYYFRRVSGDVYLCSGMAVSTTAVVFPFPFTMRANPTITMTGTISAVGSGGILAVSSVNSVGRASNAIQVRLTVSGATQYGAYLLTPSNGGYLDFTADL